MTVLTERRSEQAVALAVVATVIAALLSPVLMGHETLFYRDLYRQHLGTGQLVHDGLPDTGLLWDPLLHGGQPLLGNPNRLVLYPTRLLYRWIAPLSALNWEITLHLLLGGFGTVRLVLALGGSGSAAMVSGLGFALGGVSISLTNHLGRLFAFHWAPMLLLAVEMAARRGSGWARWGWVVGIVAVQWLSGAAEVVVLSGVLAVLWVSVRADRLRPRIRAAVSCLGALSLGTAVAAVQVIPAAEMVLRSERVQAQTDEGSLMWSVHPLRLAELIVPGAFGAVDRAAPQNHYWGAPHVDGGFPYLLSLHLGLTLLVLGLAGFSGSVAQGSVQRRRAWLLMGALVLGIGFALGRHLPFIGVGLQQLPVAGLVRFPVKWMILAAVGVVLLAARGVDGLVGGEGSSRRIVGASGTAIAVIGGVLGVGLLTSWSSVTTLVVGMFPLLAEIGTADLAMALLRTTAVAVCLVLIAVVARPANQLYVKVLLVSLATAELSTAAAAALPVGPRQEFEGAPAVLSLVREGLGRGRFFRAPDPPFVIGVGGEDRAWVPASWWRSVLEGREATRWGVPMVFVRDEERLAWTEMKRFERQVMRMPWSDRLPWLRVAGVSVVMTSDEIECMPLITTLSAGPDLIYRLYRLDPEPEPITVFPGIVADGGSPTSVERWWLPEVILWEGELDAGSGGWLVTHFAWHPDIKIGVDGVFRRADRNHVAFASTPITSGVHDVRVVFAPRAVALGILVSSLALLIVVVVVVAEALRQSSEPSVAKT